MEYLFSEYRAMGRDPNYYADPSEFNPERFLGADPEPDPYVFAFGFGRRYVHRKAPASLLTLIDQGYVRGRGLQTALCSLRLQ